MSEQPKPAPSTSANYATEEVLIGATTYIKYYDTTNASNTYFYPKGKSIKDKEFAYKQYFDPNKQRHYFSNLATKATTWKLPDINAVDQQSKPASAKPESNITPTLTETTSNISITTSFNTTSASPSSTDATSTPSSASLTTDKNSIQKDTIPSLSTPSTANEPARVMKTDIEPKQPVKSEEIVSSPVIQQNKPTISTTTIQQTNEKPTIEVPPVNVKAIDEKKDSQAEKLNTPRETTKESLTPRDPSPRPSDTQSISPRSDNPDPKISPRDTEKEEEKDITAENPAVARAKMAMTRRSSMIALPRKKSSFTDPSTQTQKSTSQVYNNTKASFTSTASKDSDEQENFDDFNFASGERASGTGKNIMFMKEDINSSTASPTDSLRNTVLLDLSFDTGVRGELEDDIEEECFRLTGMGEVHVLVVIKVLQTVDQKSKKKEDRLLVIARDYVGSFVLFILNHDAKSKQKNKRFTIVSSYCMVEGFEFKDIEKGKDNEKCTFVVDGNDIFIMTSGSLKEKLDQCCKYIYALSSARTLTEKYTYKLATSEFARVYSPKYTGDAPGLVEKIINGKLKNEDVSQFYQELYQYIIDIDQRDKALEKLVSLVEGGSFNAKRSDVYIYVLYLLLKVIPVQNKGSDIRNKFDKIMKKLSPKDSAGYNFEDLQNHIQNLNSALEVWEGRVKLQEVPFTKEFMSQTGRNTKEKRKQKVRETFINKFIGEYTIFFSAVLYTKDGDILGDANENLPSIKLDEIFYSEWERKLTPNHPDFDWLVSLGKGITPLAKILKPNLAKMQSLPPLRRAVLSAIANLSTTLNTDLGVILDRPMRLGDNTILIVAMQEVASKGSLSLSSMTYKWHKKSDFEHKLYQKYDLLDEITILEKLEISLEGPRWLEGIIQTHQSFNMQLQPGLHIGYLKMYRDHDNFYVMVQQNAKHLIPSEFVASNVTKEDWEWIQTIRIREHKEEQLLDDSDIVESETPDSKCTTFKQKFVRSLLRLEEKVPCDNLGFLYDLEQISFDEQGKIKLVLYIDILDQDDELYGIIPLEFKKNYTFITLSKYLGYVNTIFNQKTFDFVQKAQKPFYETYDAKFTNESMHATDELFRERVKPDFIVSLDSKIQFLNWMPKVINWFYNGSPSILESAVENKQNLPLATLLMQENQTRQQQLAYFTQISTLLKSQALAQDGKWKKYSDDFDALESKNISQQMATTKKEKPVIVVEDEEDFDKIAIAEFSVQTTLPEVFDIDKLSIEPTNFEMCQILMLDFVEDALLQAEEIKSLFVIESVMEEMVTIVETNEDTIESVTVQEYKEEVQKWLYAERKLFKLKTAQNFQSIAPSQPFSTEQTKLNISQPMTTGGSSKTIGSYDTIIVNMLLSYANTIDTLQGLFKVVASAQDTIELVEILHSMETSVEKTDSIIASAKDTAIKVTKQSIDSLDILTQESIKNISEQLISETDNIDALSVMEEERKKAIESFAENERAKVQRQTVIQERLLKSAANRSKFGFQGFSAAANPIVTPPKKPKKVIQVLPRVYNHNNKVSILTNSPPSIKKYQFSKLDNLEPIQIVEGKQEIKALKEEELAEPIEPSAEDDSSFIEGSQSNAVTTNIVSEPEKRVWSGHIEEQKKSILEEAVHASRKNIQNWEKQFQAIKEQSSFLLMEFLQQQQG